MKSPEKKKMKSKSPEKIIRPLKNLEESKSPIKKKGISLSKKRVIINEVVAKPVPKISKKVLKKKRELIEMPKITERSERDSSHRARKIEKEEWQVREKPTYDE
jgi:hypothetical protein